MVLDQNVHRSAHIQAGLRDQRQPETGGGYTLCYCLQPSKFLGCHWYTVLVFHFKYRHKTTVIYKITSRLQLKYKLCKKNNIKMTGRTSKAVVKKAKKPKAWIYLGVSLRVERRKPSMLSKFKNKTS